MVVGLEAIDRDLDEHGSDVRYRTARSPFGSAEVVLTAQRMRTPAG
jgi:hypothetical protein